MSNQIQTYQDARFGELRVVEQDGEPWFLASDVCKALNHTNVTVAMKMLDDDEKNTLNFAYGYRGNPTKNVISEAGLYKLILRSNKPEAKAFQRWVTHEVLPAIRKRGGYMVADPEEAPEITMARAVLIAKDALERAHEQIGVLEQRNEALRTEKQILAQENDHLQARADYDAPKVALAEAVLVSNGTINVADLANILQQAPGSKWRGGRNTLHKQLMKDGYTRRNRNGDIVPSQKSMDLGVLSMRESQRLGSNGTTHIDLTTMVTPKGQEYFLRRYAGVSK